MKGIYSRVLLVLVLMAGAGRAFSEEWNKLSPLEKEKLQKGEVIYKSVKTADAEGKISGYGQSMAIIKSPIDKCWQIFTQFDKQAEYFPRKTVSQVIEQKPGFALVQKEFKFFGVRVRYVNQYKIDEKNYRIDFEMDKSKPHDIKDTAGFFLFEKLGSNQTLFVYGVTRTDTGIAMPGFVQEYIAKRDLPAVAENVRKRIESGGAWKKDSE
jgi:uncharacterized protein YndB with AHSA1/START domain